MMNYEEYKRKKEQLEKRKEQLKNQTEIVNKSLKLLKLNRLRNRMDDMKD